MLFVWFGVKKKCKSSYAMRKGKLLTRLIYYACGLYGRQLASFIETNLAMMCLGDVTLKLLSFIMIGT